MNRPAMYSRPDKPLTVQVRDRNAPARLDMTKAPEILTVDKATECHVTPDPVARRMVAYLGPVGDDLTLEPSAGTGQLVRALLDAGHSPCELCMVERHKSLAHNLRRLGPVINRCFLDYAQEVQGRATFPRILMNPPFSKTRQHISAALSLLGRGGHQEPATLVALVPVTYRNDAAEELEQLPDDTFSTAKVHTKIIRFMGVE
ncbi:methyltransferase type 11 [Palleronia caenipelagi]|uniref:Methyltransferase type 11 n=1 Tax=Palleronia caenipelagi TaxID=2489174 RepID=A0A547PLK7_9RHOB|nr:methyltransferase type 11 [Palleronia caenipelagi]TRD14914.1 methyltransferase type 11 [Palleronia caenipelagi]